MKRHSNWGLLSLVLLLTGCGANVKKKNQTESPKTPAEVGASLESGPVLLNVSGAGYQMGDVTRIETNVVSVTKGDVILFDWRKATAANGFGPKYLIGEVIAMPGDEINMAAFLKYSGRDGKEKNAWFGTFERRGAKNYDSKIALSAHDYLVETDKDILIVDHTAIGALIVERLGHDNDAEKEMTQRVY